MRLLLSVLIVVVKRAVSDNVTDIINIPKDFMIGTCTSAYQIEGAWNQSGKGVNIWDTFVHSQPDMILDHSTADIAADSYNKWKDDINILKELQVNFYIFSISWARILPNGDLSTVNKAGIEYYNNLINELTNNNITCMVVMYHWDLPQKLQDLGGWANPILANFFEDYASVLYKNFGDKVKWWITMSEPNNIVNGYNVSYNFPPAIDSPQVGLYLATHTLLLAHARAFHLYKNEFFSSQQGQVGIALGGNWFEPADKNSKADQDAAEFALEYQIGMFANPIFSNEGDYPQVVKNRLQTLSLAQGYPRSRLRNFTEDEVNMIKGSFDFLGIDYYTSTLVRPGNWTDDNNSPDNNVSLSADPKWPKTAFSEFQVVPTGIRNVLKWIKQRYNNPKVLITENGYADEGGEQDSERIKFIVSHISELMKAKNEDDCNIIGYTVWSLMDSFEWNKGYTLKFGLYSVDFNNINRTRTAKSSAYYFKEIIVKRQVPGYIIKDSGEIVVDMTFFKIGKDPVIESITKSAAITFINYKGQIKQVWLAIILTYICYKLYS